MFLGFLTLLTSLVISGVAIYYSVSGLAAIFAAAAIPIIIMGASLEVGKLVTALWLHRNWKTAPFALKTYLMVATVVLMFITSIGIFGFLSRAHIEQTAGIGTVSTQIEQINLDIRLEQDKIDNNRKIIAQLDTAVNNLLAGSATQSQQTRTGNAQQASNLAAQATRLRQQQNAERTKLQTEITQASNKIAELNRKKLEFDQKIKNIETEVGPIKYIAQFVYGVEAGNNKDMLEKAVTWLILIIIFVFDPLAVLLLIASQISWMEASERRRSKKDKESTTVTILETVEKPKSEIHTEEKKDALDIPNSNTNDRNEPEPVVEQPIVNEPAIPNSVPSVNTQITDAVTEKPEPAIKTDLPKKKRIRNKVLKIKEPEADVAKIEPITYVQNQEQSANDTLWKNIQQRKLLKPMDVLYREYDMNQFQNIDFSDQDQSDPVIQTLIKYVNGIREKKIKFEDILPEHAEKLADLITRE